MNKVPTVKNVLRKKHSRDIEGYVTLRIGIPGVSVPVFQSYGYSIKATDWDEVNEVVKKSHKEFSNINSDIGKKKADLQDIFKSDSKAGILINKAYVISRINPEGPKGSFLQFYDSFIELKKTRCSKAYVDHILIEYNSLKKFGGPGLRFEDITSDFLERYEMSLTGIASTTLYKKMKVLKEVIEKGIKRELIRSKHVADYKYPVYEEPETDYLTLDQTVKLADNLYKGEYDYDNEMQCVVSYFLVECYSGIRFSDWSRFEVEKLVHDRNLKVRAKKNGEPVYLPLKVFKRLGKVIDYIQSKRLKFELTEHTTNRILKHVIGKELKVKFDLTTHVGRHTCGTLLGEMGYTTRGIADVLGITPATAARYIKHTRQSLNNEFERYGGL